jgi:hypothetical protein
VADVVDVGPHLTDLVDHHCHGILTADLDRAAFEGLMNEAVRASPLGTTLFDSMMGWAIRRHCAPVLGLEPLAPADDYLARRVELGGRKFPACQRSRSLARAVCSMSSPGWSRSANIAST